jgi:Zn ribbon nucleic-acid-binding protein
MVRAKTLGRVDRLRAAIGSGCPACRDRPTVHLLGEGDPLPETRCRECGRRFADEVHVFLGIDPATI